MHELLKELCDVRDGKSAVNLKAARSPKRRQSKTAHSSNQELGIIKDERSILLSASKIAHLTFLYNFNIYTLIMGFADGRRLLDR